jgi:hypothetical protein
MYEGNKKIEICILLEMEIKIDNEDDKFMR